jgi:hypothetical protein
LTAKKRSTKPNSRKVDPALENPLIVDLPDGQKLVVGKLADGSIIEIATWRGTGRPDSRTSRLMLGMANGQPTQERRGEGFEGKNSAPKNPEELIQQAKNTFNGLKARFAPRVQTEAEQLVEEEFIAPRTKAKKIESAGDVSPKDISHIQKAGGEYLDRLTSRKALRRINRIKRDPVAAEIDLWFQKVLQDVRKRSDRAEKKETSKPRKQATRPKKKVVKKAPSRTSGKKKTASASKTKKR